MQAHTCIFKFAGIMIVVKHNKPRYTHVIVCAQWCVHAKYGIIRVLVELLPAMITFQTHREECNINHTVGTEVQKEVDPAGFPGFPESTNHI